MFYCKIMIKYFLSTLLLLSFSCNAIEITSPAFGDGESIPKSMHVRKEVVRIYLFQ